MAQKYKYLLLLFVTGIILTSCKKFLTVQPEDQYTEEQVFSNKAAIQQALNGLYMNLALNTLYGANLSSTTIEIMAQRYNTVTASNNSYLAYQQYAYTNTTVMATFNNIWTDAYANITKTNKFIASLEVANQKGIIDQQNANLLKGEAFGIRAMLHFDLLRLFGPVFATSPNAAAIPYYSRADGLTRPILPAAQVLDSVLADLSVAKTLLADDPVTTNGITTNADFYSGYRNQRLNYYAIMGLQARVYLYGGNSSAANQTAKQALEEAEKWFPWADPNAIKQGISPDRVFSPEIMFGVYNQNLYTNFTTYFSPDLSDVDILAPLSERLSGIFENNQNDYRYTTTWLPSAKNYLVFGKYRDIGDATKPWRFIQPLLRKSEMYYIIAETDPNPTEAFAALDSVRYNRGLGNLDPSVVLATEIKKEYQKEFWGEGQLFFYYKRTNTTSIPSGTSTGNVSMDAGKYVVPLPLSEITPR